MLELILSGMQNTLQTVYEQKLLALNRESAEYGLILTKKDAEEIIEARIHALKLCDRIDMGISVTEKIIRKFCQSGYISQDDYVEIISEIQNIFYCLKNETEDTVPDDKLIDIMWNIYERLCRGSIEGLRTKADTFAQRYRYVAAVRESRKDRKDYLQQKTIV